MTHIAFYLGYIIPCDHCPQSQQSFCTDFAFQCSAFKDWSDTGEAPPITELGRDLQMIHPQRKPA